MYISEQFIKESEWAKRVSAGELSPASLQRLRTSDVPSTRYDYKTGNYSPHSYYDHLNNIVTGTDSIINKNNMHTFNLTKSPNITINPLKTIITPRGKFDILFNNHEAEESNYIDPKNRRVVYTGTPSLGDRMLGPLFGGTQQLQSNIIGLHNSQNVLDAERRLATYMASIYPEEPFGKAAQSVLDLRKLSGEYRNNSPEVESKPSMSNEDEDSEENLGDDPLRPFGSATSIPPRKPSIAAKVGEQDLPIPWFLGGGSVKADVYNTPQVTPSEFRIAALKTIEANRLAAKDYAEHYGKSLPTPSRIPAKTSALIKTGIGAAALRKLYKIKSGDNNIYNDEDDENDDNDITPETNVPSIKEMSVSAGLPAFESPSIKKPITPTRKAKNEKEKYYEDDEETENVNPRK